jgi:dephospho-CoA kinase
MSMRRLLFVRSLGVSVGAHYCGRVRLLCVVRHFERSQLPEDGKVDRLKLGNRQLLQFDEVGERPQVDNSVATLQEQGNETRQSAQRAYVGHQEAILQVERFESSRVCERTQVTKDDAICEF